MTEEMTHKPTDETLKKIVLQNTRIAEALERIAKSFERSFERGDSK